LKNFDIVAPFYDGLSHFIFGSRLGDIQKCLIPYVKPFSRILILGGGTGFLLDEISKIHKGGLAITCLDNSEKMIGLSKRRYWAMNNVEFVLCDIKEYQWESDYFDIVFTPFFLDCFDEESLRIIVPGILQSLRRGGRWLHADFVCKNCCSLTGKMMHRLMYYFFRFACNIKASSLVPLDPFLIGVNLIGAFSDSNNFTEAMIWEKISD